MGQWVIPRNLSPHHGTTPTSLLHNFFVSAWAAFKKSYLLFAAFQKGFCTSLLLFVLFELLEALLETDCYLQSSTRLSTMRGQAGSPSPLPWYCQVYCHIKPWVLICILHLCSRSSTRFTTNNSSVQALWWQGTHKLRALTPPSSLRNSTVFLPFPSCFLKYLQSSLLSSIWSRCTAKIPRIALNTVSLCSLSFCLHSLQWSWLVLASMFDPFSWFVAAITFSRLQWTTNESEATQCSSLSISMCQPKVSKRSQKYLQTSADETEDYVWQGVTLSPWI